jgi:hypothetical protein
MRAGAGQADEACGSQARRTPYVRATLRFRSPAAHGRPSSGGPMLDRIGILGFLGIIIFVAWFVGWIFLGFHDGLYHLLFPVSVVLMVAQGVRRVAR